MHALPRSVLTRFPWTIVFTLGFVVWTLLVFGNDGLPSFDRRCAETMQQLAGGHDFRRDALVFFTFLGSTYALGVLAGLGAFATLLVREWKLSLTWAVAVALGALFNVAIKTTLDRERPPRDMRDAAVYEDNESYPSGHSMGSMIGLGMLACACTRALRRRAPKVSVVLLAAIVILLIGFSRIYLRAHWFSDVVGGFLAGAAWLAFAIAVLRCWEGPRVKEAGA